MDTHRTPPGDAASTDAAAPLAALEPFNSAHPEEGLSEDEDPSRRARIGWIEGHLPDIVDPLVPRDPGTALSETRRLRHDGWTPEKQRRFLERFAEGGIVVEACEAVGMSARSAYNLRDRDPLFAAGWEAAQAMARPRLADEAYARALNGVVDRIYKDGMVVAERHRYDNRLTMSVLARLDARHDRAEEAGAPHLALVARWDDYLDALEAERRADGLAILAGAAGKGGGEAVRDRELRELHGREGSDIDAGDDGDDGDDDDDEDRHLVWEDGGEWWTDYPPPPGFAGEEDGDYGHPDYRRALSPGEQAVIDADLAAEMARARARGEAQRAAWFGETGADEDGQGDEAPDSGARAAPGPRAGETSPGPLPPPCVGDAQPVQTGAFSMADTSHDIRILNSLTATTIDSVDGYTEAAKGAGDSRFAGLFTSRAAERREVASRLQAEVTRLGGEPEDDGTALAGIHRAFLDLKAAMVSRDDKAIVSEVERGEDHIKAKFEEALADDQLSPGAKAVVQQGYVSVRQGHDEMRDLKHALAAAS